MAVCLNDDLSVEYVTATPVNIWPQQPYPATRGPRLSGKTLLATQQAWALYERVEAYDAAQRQLTKPVWYQFASTSEATQYRKGQLLHATIMPCVDWTSQRFLGPVSAGGDVRPTLCAGIDVV